MKVLISLKKMADLILLQIDVCFLEGQHQCCALGSDVAFFSHSFYLLGQITVERDTVPS